MGAPLLGQCAVLAGVGPPALPTGAPYVPRASTGDSSATTLPLQRWCGFQGSGTRFSSATGFQFLYPVTLCGCLIFFTG
jgi:hypothetical protein